VLNRRELLLGGLSAAVAAQAASGDKMSFAMSGHLFRHTLPHPEEGIKITARYGYQGLEPFREDVAKYLDKPPEEFKRVLDASNIALVSISGGGDYLDPAKVPQTTARDAAQARYISHFGCKHLKVNLGQRPNKGAGEMTTDQLKTLSRNLNEIGKRTMEFGVKYAFHPHCWTQVEREPELKQVMDQTDPKLVSIIADTCHLQLGGIDPVKCIRDYYSRIAAIHLKDADPKYKGWKGPAPSQEEHARVNLYKELGAGGVDFPAIFRVLRERKYDGWVTLDFDAPRPGEGTVEEHMILYKKYLIEKLNVTTLRS
jgi:inosose dehydratase